VNNLEYSFRNLDRFSQNDPNNPEQNIPQNDKEQFFNYHPIKNLFIWKKPSKIELTQVIDIPKLFWMKSFIEQTLIFPNYSLSHLTNLSEREKLELIYSLLCFACNMKAQVSSEIHYYQMLSLANFEYFEIIPNKKLKYTIQDLKDLFVDVCNKLKIKNE
jgi:hypothetical protein